MKTIVYRLLATVATLVAVLAIPCGSIAHDGPVDRDGCHRDAQGRRHCH